MAQHTPGPWILKADPYENGTPYFRIFTADSLFDEDQSQNFEISAIMCEADARLIASAPDLLDALRECQAALAMVVAPDAIRQTTAMHAFAHATAAEAKARAALEKAGA